MNIHKQYNIWLSYGLVLYAIVKYKMEHVFSKLIGPVIQAYYTVGNWTIIFHFEYTMVSHKLGLWLVFIQFLLMYRYNDDYGR